MNAKETLNKIHQKYACKGDIIFRTAIQAVVECGQQTFMDNEWYQKQIKEIDDRHDAAEAEGKWLFVTRDFEKSILECAKELSAVNAYDFLKYIQTEVWVGGSVGEIDYQEAIELLKACIYHIDNCTYFKKDVLGVLYDIGFDDDQIEFLGFEHLVYDEE